MRGGLVEVIEARGLLPMHDPHLLSATAILAREPVQGSWWSHPRANEMYRAMTEVEDHDDVEVVKLLAGKLTFIHRRLWSPLFAVVTERDTWQTKDLPAAAVRLLARLDEIKRIRADGIRELKKEVKLIEARLLAFVMSEHTESGRHERVLESWEAWRKRVALAGRKPAVAKARAELEEAAAAFAPLKLPWMKRRSAGAT